MFVILSKDIISLDKFKNIATQLGGECVDFKKLDKFFEFISANHVDCIFIDYDDENIELFDIVLQIRQYSTAVSAVLILISSIKDHFYIFKCIHSGCDDFFVKPVRDYSVLIAKVKTYLHQKVFYQENLILLEEQHLIIERYKLSKIIGYGQHSIVFLAEDITDDNKLVAIKEFPKDYLSDQQIEKIKQILNYLIENPLENYIKIIDYGIEESGFYIVEEYADGGNLNNVFKPHLLIPEDSVLKMLSDIIDGLFELERLNYSHLALKPGNILKVNQKYKISDFGIIELLSLEEPENIIYLTDPAYAAPELFTDDMMPDVMSDIYSLGVILYQLLSGDNPFIAKNKKLSMYKQIHLKPVSLLEFNIPYSMELLILVQKMLEKSPKLRPQLEDIKNSVDFLLKNKDGKKLHSLSFLCNKPALLKQFDDLITHDIPRKKTDFNNEELEEKRKEARRKRKQNKQSKSKLFMLYALSGLLVIAILLLLSNLNLSFFKKDKSIKGSNEYAGAPSVLKCIACGEVAVQKVIDIQTNKCTKCGGKVWYAYKCNECGDIFTWDFDQLRRRVKRQPEKAEMLFVCPNCHSNHFHQILPDYKKSH